MTTTTGTLPADVELELVPVAPATDQVVDVWFNETTSNRGLDVALFNFLAQRCEVLKARLAKIVKG